MELSHVFLLLSWGVLVGAVFSSIGAAGGILASFGLITVIGVTDPNNVKPMAQVLTLATALFFVPSYIKRAAYVLPLGLMISAGGVVGAIVGSTFSKHYLSDMSTFRPLFGVLALLVAVQIFWKLFSRKTHTPAFEFSTDGVRNLTLNNRRMTFDYGKHHYAFNPWLPWFAGFIVAVVASIFGVGGGFLLVPFMASVLHMPMFIIPATAAIAVFVSGGISIANYLKMGAELDYLTLLFLIAGGLVGAMIGPQFNQVLKESWLQMILAIIVTLIGVKYLLA
jgi:uncharacterized membrane protein YfcA